MSDKKNNHTFTVDLTGLNLSEEHIQHINISIQNAVSSELASLNVKVPGGGFVDRCILPNGKWYIKDLGNLGIRE